MAERHIVFFGLISHISDSEDFARKIRAALVNGDEHPHNAYIITGPGQNKTHPVKSTQLTVLVGGVPLEATADSSDPAFMNQVPHLGFVGDGQLLPAVANGTSSEATTYFTYPGGKLFTQDVHEDLAEFRQGKRKIIQPVAKTVLLTFDDQGQSVHIRDGASNIEVTDQCVLIANATPAKPPHNHFIKHGELTDGVVPKPRRAGSHTHVPSHPTTCGWIAEAIRRLTETSRSSRDEREGEEHTGHDHGQGGREQVATSLEEFLALHRSAVDIECSQSQWP